MAGLARGNGEALTAHHEVGERVDTVEYDGTY